MVALADLVRAGALTFLARDADLRPGDVVVPGGGNRFDATVVDGPPEEAGDAWRHGGTRILRCDSEVLDPYFLAGFLHSEGNRRKAAGTTGGSYRLDLRRCRVPRMPLAVQRRYGDAFRRLTAVTDRIDRIAATARNAVRTGVYGLTSGVLLPEDAQ
jgi:hypothetical protein